MDGPVWGGWDSSPHALQVRADGRSGLGQMALHAHRAVQVLADRQSSSERMALHAHRAVQVLADGWSSLKWG